MVAPERALVDRHALDHAALGHPLAEPVADRRQRRVVGDPSRERRGHRDDRAAGRDLDTVGRDRDPVAVCEPAHRGRQLDDALELLGHPQRDQLGAADDAVLLGALGVREPLEGARRADVEEDVEQRQVARLARPDADDREAQDVAGDLGPDVAPHPRRERLGVPALRLRRRPGGVEGTADAIRLSRHIATPTSASPTGFARGSCPSSGPARRRARRGWRRPCRWGRSRAPDRRSAAAPGPGWGPPTGPDLDHLAVADRLIERPPADPVARLEHDHLAIGPGEARAASPASPAPTTTTSTSRRSIVRRAYPSIN